MLRFIRLYPLPAIACAGLVAGLSAQFLLVAPEFARWVFLATLVVCGGPLVWQTLRGIARGRFAADIVAMLAIVTALIIGQYFAGVVIAFMQSSGEALERYAMRRASSSLEALFARAPKVGLRVRDGQVEEVPVSQIRVGDQLLVRPGDLVPVDGEVTNGTAAVDQSALTGEPLPIRAVQGTRLLSGSISLDGALRMRAVRAAEGSQYQQIVRLVEQARREKPPIQRLADRFAVWFTPLTLAMCGVAWVVTGSATSVLAVLVAATPCPLILATPIAVIAGISRAAELGIIVKTGAALEQVGRARAVVFDKTGTLTLGHPTVAHVEATNGTTSSDFLRFAAGVEQLSSHHLGKAVAETGRERFGLLPEATDFLEAPGAGASASVEGRSVAIGSAGYLVARGVAVPPSHDTNTTAYVSVDGRLAGRIEFADPLRPQVPSLIRRLPSLGVSESVMLTGDREGTAEVIAAQAGIRTVRANLLPAGKVEALQELRRRYGTVVMVGDGINDAPALAAATVGIAMGEHGTAVSADAADIVLLVDDISRVGDALAISGRMRRIALQSIGVGLGVSFLLMVIASIGLLAPAVGALMQEALDVAVILNALRVR
jgi:heavy metal translocating P-type ATPase